MTTKEIIRDFYGHRLGTIETNLKELEDVIMGAEDRLYTLEYELFCEVRDTIAAEVVRIQSTAKAIAGIDDDKDIISPDVLEPVQRLKVENLGNHNPRLHTDEVLIALAITAATSIEAKKAMNALAQLRNAELHSSVILAPVDVATFRKLGINLTCEPKYQTKKLYHG